MNKKHLLIIPIFLLIFTAPTLATNYTEQYCQDNETLITEHYYDNGTKNITTKREITHPYYGCENNSAVQPGPSFQYGSLILGGLAAFIALNLVILFAIKPNHGALQFGIIILTLILLYYLAMSIGLIGEPYTAIENIETGSQLMYSLASVYFWFMFLVIGYFIVTLLKNILIGASKGGKPKDFTKWGD